MNNTSTKSSITVITDPLIEPFYIVKDMYCYTIQEDVSPKTNNRESKPYTVSHGHYSSFGNTLKGIAFLLTNKDKEYHSIKEYLEYFNKIQNQISKLLNLNI
jgi:hypothetical protein